MNDKVLGMSEKQNKTEGSKENHSLIKHYFFFNCLQVRSKER